MNDTKELSIIRIQETFSIIFIITAIISIVLTYNKDLNIQKKRPIFTRKEAYYISCINRFIILIIFLAFLFVSTENVIILKEKGKTTKFAELEVLASILSLIAGLIILYTVINNPNTGSVSDIENPAT